MHVARIGVCRDVAGPSASCLTWMRTSTSMNDSSLSSWTRSTRIAHVSDVHMLERRPGGSRSGADFASRVVSIGRELDADDRVRKLKRSLDAAWRSGAGHLVVSGDLTEVGTRGQYEMFAEVLHDGPFRPDQVTLTPGNHDAYTRGAWDEALQGPLAAFRESSAKAPGHVVDRGDVVFVPIDVACHQAITRSSGELTNATADAVAKRLDDTAFRSKTVILVQHHPPYRHTSWAWQWIDGLRGWARMMDFLSSRTNLALLHGHLHKVVDRIVGRGMSRVFAAPATVEDGDRPRVRLYDVRGGVLESVGLANA
ncbi:MAG: metallophosphoesterase [Polyangiaceae bacterium]